MPIKLISEKLATTCTLTMSSAASHYVYSDNVICI